MNTIETLFVPYELAVKLKALGFDEECFRYYLQDKRTITYEEKRAMPKQTENCIGSPTFSQVFRFFREKYGIHLTIEYSYYSKKWIAMYCKIDLTTSSSILFSKDAYEEAELACITKLIEIVEQQNQK